MSSAPNPILECHTSKFKLSEAKYFLNRMNEPSIFQDNDIFDFYLNAFAFSTGMVIEYVHSDFIFHKVKPRIDWVEYEQQKQGRNLPNWLKSHQESNAIQKFMSTFENERNKFEEKPLANFFKFKRNKITHTSWSGHEFSTFSGSQTTERFLASTFKLDMRQQTGKNLPLDICDSRIPDVEQVKLLKHIAKTGATVICQEYVDLLDDFISKFDQKNFFK